MFAGALFFSIQAYAQNHVGLFSVVKGTVTIESGGKKSTAKVDDKVFPGDILVTAADSRAKLTMVDRTALNLSENSKLKIESFPTKGEKKGVLLNLSHGKLRNEVKNTYDDKNKYEVKTPTAVAGVRGTDFVVNHNLKTNMTEVQTLTGSVSFSALKDGVPSGTPVTIKFNEKASVAPNAPVEPPKVITPDERKQIETETKVIDTPTGSAPPASQGNGPGKSEDKPKDSKGKKDPGSATTTPAADAPKTRIGDSKDTAPESFDQMPQQQPVGAAPLPPPTKNLMPPPPNPRLGDAIRDKTDKTKVIIKPQGR